MSNNPLKYIDPSGERWEWRYKNPPKSYLDATVLDAGTPYCERKIEWYWVDETFSWSDWSEYRSDIPSISCPMMPNAPISYIGSGGGPLIGHDKLYNMLSDLYHPSGVNSNSGNHGNGGNGNKINLNSNNFPIQDYGGVKGLKLIDYHCYNPHSPGDVIQGGGVVLEFEYTSSYVNEYSKFTSHVRTNCPNNIYGINYYFESLQNDRNKPGYSIYLQTIPGAIFRDGNTMHFYDTPYRSNNNDYREAVLSLYNSSNGKCIFSLYYEFKIINDKTFASPLEVLNR